MSRVFWTRLVLPEDVDAYRELGWNEGPGWTFQGDRWNAIMSKDGDERPLEPERVPE